MGEMFTARRNRTLTLLLNTLLNEKGKRKYTRCLINKRVFIVIRYSFTNLCEHKSLYSLFEYVIIFPEHVYLGQVETMIMLVGSRKLEISANAFTVNVPIVLTFAGRIISYVVLIIQYFYKKVFFQIE